MSNRRKPPELEPSDSQPEWHEEQLDRDRRSERSGRVHADEGPSLGQENAQREASHGEAGCRGHERHQRFVRMLRTEPSAQPAPRDFRRAYQEDQPGDQFDRPCRNGKEIGVWDD
jgi:hypothetical protein